MASRVLAAEGGEAQDGIVEEGDGVVAGVGGGEGGGDAGAGPGAAVEPLKMASLSAAMREVLSDPPEDWTMRLPLARLTVAK